MRANCCEFRCLTSRCRQTAASCIFRLQSLPTMQNKSRRTFKALSTTRCRYSVSDIHAISLPPFSISRILTTPAHLLLKNSFTSTSLHRLLSYPIRPRKQLTQLSPTIHLLPSEAPNPLPSSRTRPPPWINTHLPDPFSPVTVPNHPHPHQNE